MLDVNDRKSRRVGGEELLKRGLAGVRVPGRGLKLFYLRRLPDDDGPRHLWGGKRISEKWDAGSGNLTLELQGPPGVEDVVLVASGARPVGEVRVNGERGRFFVDAPQRVVHGRVRYGSDPVRIEVAVSPADRDKLPESPVPRSEIPAR